MSRRAAIHGTFGVVGRGGKSRLRLWRWRGGNMVVMLMHWAITVVSRHCVA